MDHSASPRKRFHHFRPALQLRHFADHAELLWTYNRQQPQQPFRQKVTRIGGENHLYSPLTGDDPYDESVENWLADEIDGPAAEPLRRLLAGAGLQPGDRSALAAYLAVQDMRTPTARDILVPLFQRGMEQEYERWKADPTEIQQGILREDGELLSLEEIRVLMAQYAVEVPKGVWLDFLQRNVNQAGRRIFAMGWFLLTAPPGSSFVTNDIGIAKGFANPAHLVPYVMGFAAGRSHWITPLSSQTVLVLVPDERDRIGEARAEWVNAVNERLVRDAKQFIYAQDQREEIARWLDPPDCSL